MSAEVSDVDAELLAMAGDSSEDESDLGEVTQTIEHPKSPSQEPKQSVEEPPSAKRGVAIKVRKRGKKRDRKREIEEELDNLGDSPSPSASASLGSRAMSESATSADAPASPTAVEDGPLYPLEGKFQDAADKKHIMGLSEVERETILHERADQLLKQQQNLQLKKALAESEAKASKQKRKADAADLDDGGRKSGRTKTRAALDDYKRAREAKGAERSGRKPYARRDRRRSRSHSSASDRDADGESEVEWAEPSFDSRRDHDEPPADLKDFERCRIGRSNFAKVCFYPNFHETIQGCFARVSVGMNRETGQNMYRMAQIKGFTQAKPYTLEQSNGKTFSIDQYALVAHGAAEKPWPFAACSDSNFTEAEFHHYKQTLEKEHLRATKKAFLLQKLDDIHKFLNINWTEEALGAKFARQREMEKRTDPAHILSAKREAILKRKQEAEEIDDAEEAAKCQAELAALENAASLNGSPVKAKVSPLKPEKVLNEHEKLMLLNARNRGRNSDDVRKALLEERRKLHQERERALAEQKAKAAAEAAAKAAEEERKKAEALLSVPGAKGDMSDLFGDPSDISRAGTPFSGTSTPRIRRSRAGTPLNGIKKEKSGLGLLAGGKLRKKREDDLGDLDLGIDVEI